jgi:hypothetical protein
VVPYTILVFGVECSTRAVKYPRFAPRWKWTIPICLGCIALLTLGTWIPTAVVKQSDRCFGSLVWWIADYALIGAGMISCFIFFYCVLAVVIGLRLLRTAKIDPDERISASRMVYYLIFGMILLVS